MGPHADRVYPKLAWPHGYGYMISMKQIAAGKFKDQCLKLLDTVSQTRSPIVITKRGRPVAALVPYTPAPKAKRGLAGSVLKEAGDLFSTGEKWDADVS